MRSPWNLGLLLSLGLLAGCGNRVDLAMVAKFQSAQEAFDDAAAPDDFLRAAALYQEISDAGIVSGAVLYNQGNAFMRAGQRGRAVACYRQARRYRPRDPYLAANLVAALQGESVDTSRPLIEYVLFWQDWVSYPGKFQLTLWLALLTFAVAVASLFIQPTLLKRAAAACLVATLVLAGSAAYDWYRFEHQQYGVVIRNDVTARKGNGDSYEPAFTKPLPEATEFRVVDQRGGWVLLRIGGKQEGWVPSADVVVY